MVAVCAAGLCVDSILLDVCPIDVWLCDDLSHAGLLLLEPIRIRVVLRF